MPQKKHATQKTKTKNTCVYKQSSKPHTNTSLYMYVFLKIKNTIQYKHSYITNRLYVFLYICIMYVCAWAVLVCSLRPHWRFFMIFFVPFRGKILGVRRKITLSRRRSRGEVEEEEEEEVGNTRRRSW
jgi:hypothetical protein